MSSRLLTDLDPKVQAIAQAALDECAAAGIDVLVTCTYRTPAEQDALYAQGRTAKGPIVTNARAGQSFHQWRVAIDRYVVVNGKIDWSGTAPEWKTMGDIFKKHGFELGAEWVHFKELPHVQYTGGHPLSYFQSGGKL